MDYRRATRYRSLSIAADAGYDGKGPTLIDGLDLVDEQVVVLSPMDVERPARPRPRYGHSERREVRRGLG
jgi:hypothetical protein